MIREHSVLFEPISEYKQQIVEYLKEFYTPEKEMDVYGIYVSNKDKIDDIKQQTIQFIEPIIQGHKFSQNLIDKRGQANVSIDGYTEIDLYDINYFKCRCTNVFIYPLNLKDQKFTLKNDVDDVNYIQSVYVVPKSFNPIQAGAPYVEFSFDSFKVKSDIMFQFNYKIFKKQDISLSNIADVVFLIDNVSISTYNVAYSDNKYQKVINKLTKAKLQPYFDKKDNINIKIRYKFNSYNYQLLINSVKAYNEN